MLEAVENRARLWKGDGADLGNEDKAKPSNEQEEWERYQAVLRAELWCQELAKGSADSDHCTGSAGCPDRPVSVGSWRIRYG